MRVGEDVVNGDSTRQLTVTQLTVTQLTDTNDKMINWETKASSEVTTKNPCVTLFSNKPIQ